MSNLDDLRFKWERAAIETASAAKMYVQATKNSKKYLYPSLEKAVANFIAATKEYFKEP